MKAAAQTIKNPVIFSDVPDPDVIRVGNRFYMVSTTMHLTPGVPIMRSFDLANWEIVSYVYDVLETGDPQLLRNGRNMYGRGSWASSLRFHDDTFFVCFASYDSNRTYVFRSGDIERSPWICAVLEGVFHDPSLLFDDDGRVYMAYGSGAIRIREMTRDGASFLPRGVDKTILTFPPEGMRVAAEGSHLHKIGGIYYLFLIQWPAAGGGRRIQRCFRSPNVLGPYEGRIVLDDDLGYRNQGVAQGGVFDTPSGDWYTMPFQDRGAVGRVPVLVPVTWIDGWPVMGSGGKAPIDVSVTLPKAKKTALVTSDEFDQRGNRLPLQWQWNHNPDDRFWSLIKRPGCLRLTTGSTVRNILQAMNTLSQRTEGPACSGETALYTANMKPGDWAGLAAFQNAYGLIGVSVSADGEKRIVMATNNGDGDPMESDSKPLLQDTVYLKIDFDFTDGRDEAAFFYSLDNAGWQPLGKELAMRYTLDHFMGYRIALFNYATSTPGGFADFDYFRYRGASAPITANRRSS